MTQLMVVLALALPAAAPPATRPAPAIAPAPTQLTSPQFTELHLQAYRLMKEGDFAAAAEPLEKVYAGVPVQSRTRALVLNHAILDITQKKFIMRGIRDLLAYLTHHRDEDEPATNILAVALNYAADDPKLVKSDLWRAGFTEWNRRNYEMDHSREGWHRWGVRWINEEEYQALEAKRKYLREAIQAQCDRIDRLGLELQSLTQQLNNASTFAGNYMWLHEQTQMIRNDPTQGIYTSAANDEASANALTDMYESAMEAVKLSGEAQTVGVELTHENKRLLELQKQEPKPEWPARVDPIDPNATWPLRLYNDGLPVPGPGGPMRAGAGPATLPATMPATAPANDPSLMRPMLPPVERPAQRQPAPGRLYPQ